MTRSRFVVFAVLAVLLSGCGSSPAQPASQPTPDRSAGFSGKARDLVAAQRASAFPAYAATAEVPVVEVRDEPDGEVVHRLEDPQPSGAPLTFLLDERGEGWLKVHLPVRPNGSTGWVRESDVSLTGLPHRLDVVRGAHELRLFEHDELVKTYPIGIGTQDTPTPGGTFYLKELLEPTNLDGFYGPYAYGLSGFSNVLTSFGSASDAVIGLHGTSDPSSIGKDVSSGCIRLHNDHITELAELLPLGTPVRILA